MIVKCYKGKGDAMLRGNFRGLKLLEQVMKVVERMLEKILRECVSMNEMHFGFMSGKSTIEAIFIIRQLQEKYLGKHKRLYLTFDLCRLRNNL